MARREDDEHKAPRRRTPARTAEEHESILISKSLKLIEQQIDDGTVSAVVLQQYAKLGSSRGRLENERLVNENAVLRKRLDDMQAAVDVRNLMGDALAAFQGYTGAKALEEEDYYDD